MTTHYEPKQRKTPVDCCIKGCFLCNEINNHDALSDYLGLYDSPNDKIIAQTEHFLAFPDIKPVVPGHILLMTRDHHLSLSQVTHAWHEELAAIKAEVVVWVSNHYQTPFCFEHGEAAGHTASGICVQHAHLHIIPAVVDVVAYVKPYLTDNFDLSSINLTCLKTIDSSYLYYEDAQNMGFVVQPELPLPQQFIRRVVADALDLGTWDWKEVAFPYLS